MIPYGYHFLDEDDISAVVRVLKHGQLTQGKEVEAFEAAICEYTGARFAVAVSSATAALHLCYRVLGLRAGNKVCVPANTFVSTANAALMCGCEVVVSDIDRDTLNIDTKALPSLLKKDEGRISCVAAVHFAGAPCDMELVYKVAKGSGVEFVIEDAAHALGSKYKDGSSVGNCKYSDLTVFSLHPVKGVTAGEGGVITTNNESFFRELKKLRSHGIVKGNFDLPGIGDAFSDPIRFPDEALEDNKLRPWYYEMQDLGYNYRITDFQCALAASQLGKLDRFVDRRRVIARAYDRFFSNHDLITLPQIQYRETSSHHIYVLRIDFSLLSISRAQVMSKLVELGVQTQVHYIPISFHPYYRDMGFHPNEIPESQRYYSQALTMPIYYSLDDGQVEYISENLLSILGEHNRR